MTSSEPPLDPPADPAGLVARTSPRAVPPEQLVVGVFGLGALLGSLWNLVSLLFVDDRTDPAILAGGCAVFAVVALVVILRMRQGVGPELRVAQEGITVVRRGEERHWPWSAIRALYVTGGVQRLLVIEDDAVHQAPVRAQRSAAFLHKMGVPPPTAEQVSLSQLEPDELTVLTAIRACSGGLFPDAEAGRLRLGPRGDSS